MQLRIEKTRPKVEAPQPTPNPGTQKPLEVTARMQFYAIHNTGEQLRRAHATRMGRKTDRMEGR